MSDNESNKQFRDPRIPRSPEQKTSMEPDISEAVVAEFRDKFLFNNYDGSVDAEALQNIDDNLVLSDFVKEITTSEDALSHAYLIGFGNARWIVYEAYSRQGISNYEPRRQIVNSYKNEQMKDYDFLLSVLKSQEPYLYSFMEQRISMMGGINPPGE